MEPVRLPLPLLECSARVFSVPICYFYQGRVVLPIMIGIPIFGLIKGPRLETGFKEPSLEMRIKEPPLETRLIKGSFWDGV